MWKFKFGLWAVVLITSVFSFSACGGDDDNDTFVPPANIEVALKQLYPGAQNIEWEVKGVYYVADCWVTGDELEVWFDVNANWVMTENELDNVNQLVPAVYRDIPKIIKFKATTSLRISCLFCIFKHSPPKNGLTAKTGVI